jgi:hypothetical protein
MCICSLCYPARNAHAPYYHLWSDPFYNIFPHYLTHGTAFEKKKLLKTKRVLIFSTTFVWNISHSKKKWAKYDQKCTLVFMYSTLYSCPILMTLEFSQQIFEKSSDMKLKENPSRGSRVVPCGRTDMMKLIAALRSFANSPKMRSC